MTDKWQRRQVVAELAHQSRNAGVIAGLLAEQGIVNPRTQRPYSVSTIRQDLIASEIVGRVAYPPSNILGSSLASMWHRTFTKTVDQTVTDYEFWDKLRRGKLDGYRFGGLFCLPITQTLTSYLLGEGGPQLELVEEDNPQDESDPRTYTNDLLARWMSRARGWLGQVVSDLYGLGDVFIIVNPDGTLSVVSPDTVISKYDPLDYRRAISHTITTRTDDVTITDEYRLDGRTVKMQWHHDIPELSKTAGQVEIFEYNNLIGRLPVVHWSNDRAANEQRGRPLYESLLRLFSRYDDLIEKALDGAELMGNPIPVFEGMENISETKKANATASAESYTDADGNAETHDLIRFDRLAAIFVGKGGQFNFKAPPNGFTSDVRDMLKSLFLLLLDYTRMPEFIWGGAIASSKASADTQYPPFVQYVNLRRQMLEGEGADELLGMEAQGGLLELADVWLRTRRLVDPRVVVGPVRVKQWPALITDDERLEFEKVQWADENGKLTDETALSLLDLVENAREEVQAAQDAQTARDEQNNQFQSRLTEALNQANQEAVTDPTQQQQVDEVAA